MAESASLRDSQISAHLLPLAKWIQMNPNDPNVSYTCNIYVLDPKSYRKSVMQHFPATHVVQVRQSVTFMRRFQCSGLGNARMEKEPWGEMWCFWYRFFWHRNAHWGLDHSLASSQKSKSAQSKPLPALQQLGGNIKNKQKPKYNNILHKPKYNNILHKPKYNNILHKPIIDT